MKSDLRVRHVLMKKSRFITARRNYDGKAVDLCSSVDRIQYFKCGYSFWWRSGYQSLEAHCTSCRGGTMSTAWHLFSRCKDRLDRGRQRIVSEDVKRRRHLGNANDGQ